MRIFPTDGREWRHLMLLPGQAYVLAAPFCYLVWDFATAGHRERDAWVDAIEIIAMGYLICFIVFAIAGVVFCFARQFDSALTSFLFMLLTIVFAMSMSKSSVGAVAVYVFIAAWKFYSDRLIREISTLGNEEAFECPNCQAVISSSEQTCSKCGWTYVV